MTRRGSIVNHTLIRRHHERCVAIADVSHLLIPLANPRGQGTTGRRARNRAWRVWAQWGSARHRVSRMPFRAAAVMLCWSRVLASPREQAWHRSPTRSPCASVPSTPARTAARAVQTAVRCSWRAVWRARCWTAGRTVLWRGPLGACVHAVRYGQVRPSVGAKRMLMLGAPGRLVVSDHLVLRCLAGQIARRVSQFRAKHETANPALARACQVVSGVTGPTAVTP